MKDDNNNNNNNIGIDNNVHGRRTKYNSLCLHCAAQDGIQ